MRFLKTFLFILRYYKNFKLFTWTQKRNNDKSKSKVNQNYYTIFINLSVTNKCTLQINLLISTECMTLHFILNPGSLSRAVCIQQ